MTHLKTTILSAATLVVMAISNPVLAEGNSKMTQDQKDVLATIDKMTSSFEVGNLDAVMQTYETKQSIAFEPGKPLSDSAMARQIFEQWTALSPKFSYSGHEVIVEGDIAVHIAPWKMKGTDPEGNVVGGEGLSIAVLRRQSDGSWKMVIDNPHGSHLLRSAVN